MTDHDPTACTDGNCKVLACKLVAWRNGGMNLAASATPSRYRVGNPQRANPVWERGIVTERRCDGSVMPMLNAETLDPIPIKAYGEGRRGFDEQRRRLRTDPNVLSAERNAQGA